MIFRDNDYECKMKHELNMQITNRFRRKISVHYVNYNILEKDFKVFCMLLFVWILKWNVKLKKKVIQITFNTFASIHSTDSLHQTHKSLRYSLEYIRKNPFYFEAFHSYHSKNIAKILASSFFSFAFVRKELLLKNLNNYFICKKDVSIYKY